MSWWGGGIKRWWKFVRIHNRMKWLSFAVWTTMEHQDSYLRFPLTNTPILLRLPHFEIRSMARGRLKRDGDTFLRATFSFLSYLLSPWAINFMPFLSSFFFFFFIFFVFFAIKDVPLSPSSFTASYSNIPLYRKIEQGFPKNMRRLKSEERERYKIRN